jgi:murein DD-endopeptidase MepM/ murein hydrolase activator NlpD
MLLPGPHVLLPAAVVAVIGAAALRPSPGLEQTRPADFTTAGPPAATAPAYGTYGWPVRGEVIRPFEPPDEPFGAGHRGIDIAAPLGTTVRAAQSGTVAFAGPVAGSLFVSVDHPDGVRTTYSWLSEVGVRAGDPVQRGSPIGLTGPGHPGVDPSHLHFGARFAGQYIDPMLLLEGSVVGLVRLAPLEGSLE